MVAPEAASERTTLLVLTPVTASLKVAVTLAVVAIPLAPAAGVRAVTVGAVTSRVVNCQVVPANGLPATSVIRFDRETV